MLVKSRNSYEKLSNVTRIFLIILLAIVADQAMESVLLEAIAPIDPTGLIANTFFLLSIPFAIFLASLSDFHCRRRILIFSLISLSLSGMCILFFNNYIDYHWIAYIALTCKGIGGNVTPIALASLATIISPKKFTISLAIAICAYSLGSWVPIYFRSFEYLPLTVVVLSLICCVIALKWFMETKFDNFSWKNNTFNIKHFFVFARDDWKLIALFCILLPVILVFSGFIFSEISFYQILLRGEVLIKDDFYSNLSLKMGLGYYIGTGILCILKSKHFSDVICLKLGAVIAFSSIVLSSILSYSQIENLMLFYNLLILFFSFGFSLLTPSLFSMLSKIRRLNEQGKIYGLLDSTDTVSALIATKYIKISKSITYNHVLWVSSTILLISAIFIWSFIHYFKNMRQNNGHQPKERKSPQ